MGKKRQKARSTFGDTAELLIREVAAGKWNHIIPTWSSVPVEEWEPVLKEFSFRCPGHGKSEYVDALRRCQWHNR
jgi:hypothetical protein